MSMCGTGWISGLRVHLCLSDGGFVVFRLHAFPHTLAQRETVGIGFVFLFHAHLEGCLDQLRSICVLMFSIVK